MQDHSVTLDVIEAKKVRAACPSTRRLSRGLLAILGLLTLLAAAPLAANPSQWLPFGGLTDGCNGAVHAAVTMSDGRIVVGGDFTACGPVVARGIAIHDPITQRWHSVGSGLENGVRGAVRALAVDGPRIYVGGRLTGAGSREIEGITLWDGSTWQALDEGTRGTVTALALAPDGSLYAGGNFTEIGGLPANRVAQWRNGNWRILGSPAADGVDGEVFALAVDALGGLYVGGSFMRAAGLQVNRIARWDGSTWSALVADGAAGVSNAVFALHVAGDALYVGGSFVIIGSVTARRIVRWRAGQWETLGTAAQAGVSGVVFAITSAGDDIIVGGRFGSAGGVPANRMARFRNATWEDFTEAGGTGVNEVVYALTVSASSIFVGGEFRQAGGNGRNHIARWVGDGFVPLGFDPSAQGLNGSVRDLIEYQGQLIVAGDFTRAGGLTVDHIARWDGSRWHALRGSNGEIGANGPVTSLAVAQGQLYVGGAFSAIAGVAAWGVARWNGTDWSALGPPGNQGVNSMVQALASDGTQLYVGGVFLAAGDVPVGRVARWNGSAWFSLGEGAENGVGVAPGATPAVVSSLAISGASVLVGGQFTRAGSLPVTNLALWNGNQWLRVGSIAAEGVGGIPASVTSVLGQVIVSGAFEQVGSGTVSAPGLASYGGSPPVWRAFPAFSGDRINGPVARLVNINDQLLVGGDFGKAGSVIGNGIARWDGSQWHSYGGNGPTAGVAGTVRAIAGVGDSLYFGGDLGGTMAGQTSSGLVRWSSEIRFRDSFEPSP